MEAGTALDVLIAEKVMGLKPCSDPIGRCDLAHMTPPQCWGDGGGGSQVQSYSSDISAAWEVVEKMRANGFEFDFMAYCTKDLYVAAFMAHPYSRQGVIGSGEATAPLAICVAALAAVGVPADLMPEGR